MIYAHNLDADLQSCYAWARHAHDANAVLRGRLDGLDGANLVCGGCGIDIATEQSDCWVNWHDLRLEPTAVVRSDRGV